MQSSIDYCDVGLRACWNRKLPSSLGCGYEYRMQRAIEHPATISFEPMRVNDHINEHRHAAVLYLHDTDIAL